MAATKYSCMVGTFKFAQAPLKFLLDVKFPSYSSFLNMVSLCSGTLSVARKNTECFSIHLCRPGAPV